MHNCMATTVIFRQTRQEAADYILNYFSERWDTYFDLYASSELIFIPLLVEGLKRLDEEDLDVLSRLEERAEADDLIQFLLPCTAENGESTGAESLLGDYPLSGVSLCQNGATPDPFRYRSGSSAVKEPAKPAV